MLALEDRSFETRFGDRCPFCGRSWGDPRPCGDSRADRTIRDSLSLLFADRKSKNCEVCDRFIPSNRQFCYDCSAARQKHRNAQDRHRRAMSVCEWPPCSSFFEGRVGKKQRYCSRDCSDRSRVKTNCKRGHDLTVIGARDTKGDCITCRRERQRKAA